jgi:hypothetical protein
MWFVGLALGAVLIAGCITIPRTPRETDLGSHHVSVVPDCQDALTNSHRQFEIDGSSRITFYEFKCGDTTIRLDENALTVNGKPYGTVNEGDAIAVYYGKVQVNSNARAAN